MTLLTNGEVISGTFDGDTHGILIRTDTFYAQTGDNIVIKATARGYNPAQLQLKVTGPQPLTHVVGQGTTILQLKINGTGMYTVETRY